MTEGEIDMSIKSIIRYRGAIITQYTAGLCAVSYGGLLPYYVDNLDMACKAIDSDRRG